MRILHLYFNTKHAFSPIYLPALQRGNIIIQQLSLIIFRTDLPLIRRCIQIFFEVPVKCGCRGKSYFLGDKANGKSPVYTVVPGTTKLNKDYIPVHFNIEPSEIRGFLRHTTMFLPEQLVTINEEQIIQTAGMIVSTDAIKKVDAMLVRQLQIGEYDG